MRNHLPLDSTSESEADDDAATEGKTANEDDGATLETQESYQASPKKREGSARLKSTETPDDSVRFRHLREMLDPSLLTTFFSGGDRWTQTHWAGASTA